MTKNKFENLPNELLIHIFEYIDIQDLYNGLWGLNYRINNLIQCLKNLSYNLEKYDPILISLFSNQITQLIFNTWHDIDFNEFPHLKILILHQITSNQLQQIQTNILPNLIYLSTSSIPDFLLIPQLARCIFSNEIPSIRHVNLGFVHIPRLNLWSQSPSLRSVSIKSIDPQIISFILSSSPNLRYLNVHFLIDTMTISQNNLSIINHPLKEFILIDPYHKLSFNHIYTFFGLMPNLRKLQLNFQCKISFIHFAECLINRLKYLREFHCNIDDISNDKLIDIKTIQQLHPCFHRIHCSKTELYFRTFTTE